MYDNLIVILSILIAVAGWWGIGFDGALATPFTAIVLIVLIWKCYTDAKSKKELNERINRLVDLIENQEKQK